MNWKVNFLILFAILKVPSTGLLAPPHYWETELAQVDLKDTFMELYKILH